MRIRYYFVSGLITGSIIGLFYSLACIAVTRDIYVAWLVALSLATFIVFGLDKYLAIKSSFWRIPEGTLYWLYILGGFIGGFVGSRFFNHKIRRREFLIVFLYSFIAHSFFLANWFFQFTS
jgi:uncharacterized membrane protein YsdA (DUF1294 family)